MLLPLTQYNAYNPLIYNITLTWTILYIINTFYFTLTIKVRFFSVKIRGGKIRQGTEEEKG